MTIVKYNPIRRYPSTFNTFFDRFFNDEIAVNGDTKSFSPQVDIAETEKNFEIMFTLPGVNKEDIHIDVEGDQLTVSGERKFESENTEKNFRTVESYYGSFSRSFYLPQNVQTDKIDASYKDGILELIVPKDTKKENKKMISIK